MILDAIQELLKHRRLTDRLSRTRARVPLAELPGASPAAISAVLARELSVPVVLVADTPGEADELAGDLEFLAPGESQHFPQREALPYEDSDPHVEISGQRTQALGHLLAGRCRIVVTTARALAERSSVPAAGGSFSLELSVGDEVRLSRLAGRLEAMGFEAVHTIQELGEYAVRGGIVDIFPFGHERPLRIELWGDEVASIRRFDLLSQRSVERLERTEVLPVELGGGPGGPGDALSTGAVPGDPRAGDTRAGVPGPGDPVPEERRSLLELLPEGSVLFELDPASGVTRRRHLWEETEEARRTASPAALPADALVLPPAGAEERMAALSRLFFDPDGGSDLGLEAPPEVNRDMDRLARAAEEALDAGERVLILCDNQGQLERLEEILAERATTRVAREVVLGIGSLSGGLRIPGPRPLLVLTDHEIFRRARRLRRAHRFRGAATLESVASIQPGDYVVHLDHGIGRYRGLERVAVGGETIETLKIEYAGGELLRLPHYRLDRIERWTTAEDGEAPKPPRVHKLGGRQWKRLKERTVASIEETALDLLRLYAERRTAKGHAFPPETSWQREMESAFLYEETPDQLAAWEDVRRDMEEPRPMDRLVCGDVGFGKTEIAMRAAFKAVQDGRQVAMLAPTTILAEQHLHTFRERLAAFPVRVEGLSRFRSAVEQRKVLEDLAAGRVDIVVGTHRLLSGDVAFADLGLLVVDEEQRFGVRQKERLKKLRRTVDVLTLTATPIPRTLQMALGGIRDMSVIETAPRDRMPVITHVLQWNDAIIEDAMRRELDRGGQVFFVHDRVETIRTLADRVRRLLPDVRVAVAHGQMPEGELEDVMDSLMEQELDILVCTSIIENGLDVPTANTMIVHRSDRFGLAQLYQLRGRVGRSHRRAYCYLLVPADVSREAEQRLRVLEHHTELGSGYRVALRDLELRGAGNLLGAAQSGFATAVGLETYQRLVERTVRRLKGEEGEARDAPTQVSVGGDAYLPDGYILDAEQKMHLYRRLSRIREPGEAEGLREELRDRFGPLPEPAERLVGMARLRVLGSALEVEWIRVSDRTARIVFRPNAVPRLAMLKNAFTDRQLDVEVRRMEPLSLILRRAGVEPLLPTLVETLHLLAAAEGRDIPLTAGGSRG